MTSVGEKEVTTWTTKAGEVLIIKDMSTEHLWNVLRLLDRNEISFLLSKFGEMLGEMWEKSSGHPMPASHPAYSPILKELYSRNEITYDDMNSALGWENNY